MRLAPRFEHERAQALFEAFRPTLFFGVPTVYVRLLELPAPAAHAIGARTRLFVSGSAPLPAHVFEAFRARFGHAILERYGMTETLMTIGNPYDGERRPGTVGLPLEASRSASSDADGRDVPRTARRASCWCTGPAVFAGYWRRPDATAAAFAGGWFRTGDLASRAADGYVTLRGRASELILCGGFNVYPREIEDVLLEQPGVREAAVVGVPDERRGERPVAFYAGDAEPAALEAACRRQLASFKVPAAFVRVEALPRNALGKVEKHRLSDAARQGAARSREDKFRNELALSHRDELELARLRDRLSLRAFWSASSRTASASAVAAHRRVLVRAREQAPAQQLEVVRRRRSTRRPSTPATASACRSARGSRRGRARRRREGSTPTARRPSARTGRTRGRSP